MSIEIIDILKPKNGLSFKLIEDIDIAVSGYTSLADAVSHFATKEGMISAINTALSGKQDTLSTEQLAAVNSGITAQLVTQIGTNTTAIAGKASQTDLDSTNAALAGKANASDVTTATANLQAQIDAIITPVTQDAEVQNARTDENAVTYTTLKQRLDTADVYNFDNTKLAQDDINTLLGILGIEFIPRTTTRTIDRRTTHFVNLGDLKAGVAYRIVVTLNQAAATDTYFSLRNDVTVLPTNTITAGNTSYTYNYTPQADLNDAYINVTVQEQLTVTATVTATGYSTDRITQDESSISALEIDTTALTSNMETLAAIAGYDDILEPVDIANLDTRVGGIQPSGDWERVTETSNYQSALLTTIPKTVTITAQATKKTIYSFLKSVPPQYTSTHAADFCVGETGRREVAAGNSATIDVPSDCKCIVFTTLANAQNYAPSSVKISFVAANSGITKDIADLQLFKSEFGITDLTVISGGYIGTSGDTVDVSSIVTDAGYAYGVFDCVAGDVFRVTGNGGQTPRLWAFIDDEGNVLSNAAASASEVDKTLIAPTDSDKVVFNCHNYETYSFRKIGKDVIEQEKLESDIKGKVEMFTNLNRGAYFDCGSSEAVPVGENAPTYADFIENTWDMLAGNFPDEVSKVEVIKDTSDTYSIYKYIFTPPFYTKTVLLTAGMHGDEYEGYWGLYKFMELLYTKSYKYETLRRIRHNVRFIVIPVLNPYGMQNRQRQNSANADANYNYDVRWNDPQFTHTGSTPFCYNESKAVKLVCDQYNDISVHLEFHTDPYSATKGNYAEAVDNSNALKLMYGSTLDNRYYIKDTYNYAYPLAQDFVVWTNKACCVFRYMEEVRHIPSIIVEAAPNGYATGGSADFMKEVVNWYTNCIVDMLNAF